MAEPCKDGGCAHRTDRLERSLCEQKEENERLRLRITTQFEKRLCVQEEELTTRWEERLRVQKEKYDERLRAQKEEHEKTITLARDAVVECFYGYYPLPLDRFPLEVIALIADFVYDFDDLARMSLTCRSLHNGVLLSRRWIIVEAIVAATDGDQKEQKRVLHNRMECALFPCRKGLLRCLRAIALSRAEVTDTSFETLREACKYGRVDVVKHLHTTYALMAHELSISGEVPGYGHPMLYAFPHHLPVVKYLHYVMGMELPRQLIKDAAGDIKTLKSLHTELGFTVEDLGRRSIYFSACCIDCQRCSSYCDLYDNPFCGRCDCLARERLVYLRDVYGATKEDARQAIYLCRNPRNRIIPGEVRRIREVFAMEGQAKTSS